jgi:hypothetical protein
VSTARWPITRTAEHKNTDGDDDDDDDDDNNSNNGITKPDDI